MSLARYAVTASVLRLAMEETGCSIRQLAEAVGDASTSRVEAWRAGAKGLSLDALACFPAGLALRVLARMEEQKRDEIDARRSPQSIERHVMRTTASVGEFARVAAEALADGVIDDKERVALRKCTVRVIRDAEAAAAEVDRSFQRRG